MNSDHGQITSYRVEVSGWDSKENFFVEKAMLDWKGEGEKEIALRTQVRKGSVVFVRLMQPTSSGISFPVPYKTTSVAPKDANGHLHLGVEQLRPRSSSDEPLRLKFRATVRVA